MAEPYPQNAGNRTSGRGRSVSPQAHQAAVMHPNHVHALLALASSIVVAGPGFRRNPIRDPLRDVMEPSFRTHTPRARKGRYNGLSPVGPIPADRPHATQFSQDRGGVVVSGPHILHQPGTAPAVHVTPTSDQDATQPRSRPRTLTCCPSSSISGAYSVPSELSR